MGASSTVFVHRPKRVRVVCAVAAVSILLLFTLIGTALTEVGEGVFRPGDQYAMIGLGVVFAAGIMLIARPRVQADETGIKVQNIVGGYQLPWSLVRKVSFDRGRPWLSLELENDDTVSVLAVQAVDREHAVHAVQCLRSLHAQNRA
ncbi:PH domain-containing protein [Allorhizocola rhizosphaerae]|uniref:PH domain-containing protein n=1 Tax=Allorhizocola rhizosphaerae TaxID=1872709 RepID=UPI001FE683C5|nr:PH domain-containing protein [Allorhizocola rhizosphaerae]